MGYRFDSVPAVRTLLHDVGAVIATGQLAEVGVDPIDERVDVVGEDPGHGRRW